jgi:hypothetical protein
MVMLSAQRWMRAAHSCRVSVVICSCTRRWTMSGRGWRGSRPLGGETLAERLKFAENAARAGLAGGGESVESEGGGTGGVRLADAGAGDGELSGEVPAVADERRAGRGDGVLKDGDSPVRVAGDLLAGGDCSA